MIITEWIASGCDYDTGLILYSKQKRHNKNLLRLFMRKNNRINQAKLKYELQKLQKFEVAASPGKVRKVIVTPSNQVKPIVKEYRTLRLNDLPVQLHDMYRKQKDEFYRACSLKIQLNNTPPEVSALDICLEIDRLFDRIEKAWKVFDHYTKFKVVPEFEGKDYSTLSPVLLLKAEKSKREAISKAKARIKKWSIQLQKTTDKQKRYKLERQLQKKNEDLLAHEVDLERIKELIHKK